ncbi:hypothetical protein ACFWNN_29850 [Lentzea sp. NPDC058450]|uniref:hypothetical protein n=1 Tax=Lentzea sp. NPDC058450 TaxID=3346505 RepID=UPI0036670E93
MKYFVVRDFRPGVQAVIRTGMRGEQIHVGPAGWVRSGMLQYLKRVDTSDAARRVTEEEAEAVIAARPARRCFRVLSAEGPHLPFAVVAVDGEHERAFTRELAWSASELLAGLAGRSGLRVEEVSQETSADLEAFKLAFAHRTFQRDHVWEPGSYHAIFTSVEGALDLANAIALVRGDSWQEYAYRRGEWERCSLLRGISNGGNTYEELPISPDEARWLMARLDERRLRDDPRP